MAMIHVDTRTFSELCVHLYLVSGAVMECAKAIRDDDGLRVQQALVDAVDAIGELQNRLQAIIDAQPERQMPTFTH